jgi:SnoaL-like domain
MTDLTTPDLNTPDLTASLQELVDYHAVEQVLLRYASAIDIKDYVTLRACLADDIHAEYGDAIVDGGDNLITWIDGMTATKTWQHHFLSVYHVDFVSPTEAKTLTYHTSIQIDEAAPGVATKIVARYHDKVCKIDGLWKITYKFMEIGWAG